MDSAYPAWIYPGWWWTGTKIEEVIIMSERKILYTEPEDYFPKEIRDELLAEWQEDEEVSEKDTDSKKERSEDKKDGNR